MLTATPQKLGFFTGKIQRIVYYSKKWTKFFAFQQSQNSEILAIPSEWTDQAKKPEIIANSLIFSNPKNSGGLLLFQGKTEIVANSLLFRNTQATPKIQKFPN